MVTAEHPGADIGFTQPIQPVVCLAVACQPIFNRLSRTQTCEPTKVTAERPGVNVVYMRPS